MARSEVAHATKPRPTREVALEESALEAARAWTTDYRSVLAHEGRLIEGGWPGTVNEARAHSAPRAARMLALLAMAPLTADELGRIARITYAEARRLWRVGTTTKR